MPIALASDAAATTTPGDGVRAALAAQQQHASRAAPSRSGAAPSRAARDDARHAGRDEHVGVAPQARRLLAHAMQARQCTRAVPSAAAAQRRAPGPGARSRAGSCRAGTPCRSPRAARRRPAGDFESRVSERRRRPVHAAVQRGEGRPAAGRPCARAPARGRRPRRRTGRRRLRAACRPGARASTTGRRRASGRACRACAVVRADHERDRGLRGVERERVAVVVELREARCLHCVATSRRRRRCAAAAPGTRLEFLACRLHEQDQRVRLARRDRERRAVPRALEARRRDGPGAACVVRHVEVALAEPGRARIRRIGGDRATRRRSPGRRRSRSARRRRGARRPATSRRRRPTSAAA